MKETKTQYRKRRYAEKINAQRKATGYRNKLWSPIILLPGPDGTTRRIRNQGTYVQAEHGPLGHINQPEE